tara:strand:- start:3764 stop:4873 length:1110 start_codon:yes stop_codon:yes gene_type:complete
MGSFGKKTEKTKSSSTGTATTTPNAPSWLQGPAQSIYGQIGGLAGQTPNTFGASNLQNQAFSGASGLGLNSALSQAMSGTQGLMDYSPNSVQAGQLSNTDLSSYMNPYTNEVIGAAQNDFSNANDLGLNSLRSMTPNGAYGGSRQAVSAGQLVVDNTRNFANTVAQLRQGNFQNAQNMAQFDIGNRFSQDQFNSNAGMQGAQFRGNMASQLGQQGLAQDGNSRANIATQSALGDQQRDITMQNDPQRAQLAWLQQLMQTSGIDPSQFIGQTINSSGQQSGTSTSSDPWGTLAAIIGAAGTAMGPKPSDRRLKRNIVPLDADINGTPLYEFEYLWDEPGVKTIGVMAQEAPPHAVVVMDNGYLAVDYGAL